MTEALFFNSHSGYLEGVLRGFKAGLLTQTQYANLTQCESLDGQSAQPLYHHYTRLEQNS